MSSDATIWVLETNLDDTTGERLGAAMESFLKAGALDATYTPCFTKKNRPAYLLRLLAPEEKVVTLERLIFTETTSIGLRKYPVERTTMSREILRVPTQAGTALVKRCQWHDVVRYYPEHDAIATLARTSGIPYATLFAEATINAQKLPTSCEKGCNLSTQEVPTSPPQS